MAFWFLNKLTTFLTFPIITIGEIPQIGVTPVENNQRAQGEEFIKNIIHGEKMLEKPEYLLFTAPYRLCEGGCSDSGNNFAMAFPLYVGKKGKQQYKSLYQRDYKNIHSVEPNAPFKIKTTRHPFTPCPTETTTEKTTTITSVQSTISKMEIPFTTTAFGTLSEYESFSTQNEESAILETGSPTTPEISTEPEKDITVYSETETDKSENSDEYSNYLEKITFPVTILPSTEVNVIPETKKLPEITTPMISNEEKTPVINNDVYSEIETNTSEETRIKPKNNTISKTDYETDYEYIEKSSLTTGTYITNANGVRCPIPIRNICKKKISDIVTAQIVTLKFNPDVYDTNSGDLDAINYLYSD